MRKILILIMFCFIANSAISQDIKIIPAIGATYQTAKNNFGCLLELKAKYDRFNIGFYGEYSVTDIATSDIKIVDFTRITNIYKDVEVWQFGLVGEYFPTNLFFTNPYIFGRAGQIVALSKTAYALSGGIGTEFFVQLSDKSSLRPFVEIGYQGVIKPIENLDQNGLRFEVGTAFFF